MMAVVIMLVLRSRSNPSDADRETVQAPVARPASDPVQTDTLAGREQLSANRNKWNMLVTDARRSGSWEAVQRHVQEQMLLNPAATLATLLGDSSLAEALPLLMHAALEQVTSATADITITEMQRHNLPTVQFDEYLGQIIGAVSVKDADKAMSLLKTHGRSGDCHQLSLSLAANLALQRGLEGLSFLQRELGTHPQAGAIVAGAVSQLARVRPDDALTWLAGQSQTMDAGTLRDACLASAPALIEQGRAGQLDKLMAAVSSRVIDDASAAQLAGLFASADPDASLEWLRAINDQDTRRLAEQSVLPVISGTQPDKAAAYMRTPEGGGAGRQP